MKHFLITAALAVATITAPALAVDAGVSVNIGQPGFYGRLDIGGFPQPPVIYSQPRVIERVEVNRPPIYLHVPPGHAKDWRKHCRHYNACGERVFFVHNDWYDREYVPRYQERHGHGRDGRGDGHRKDDRGDHKKKDRHNGDREHGRDR